jgi:hypothetical protein
MKWGPSAVLALCALVFAVAGCGGGSDGGQLSPSAYKSRLAVISKHADAAHNGLSQEAREATTVPQVEAALRRYAAAEERIGEEVSKLKPPTNAAAANAELARGERDDAAEIRALIPKLSTFKSVQETFSYLQTIPHTKGGTEQNEALATLRKLGYTNAR